MAGVSVADIIMFVGVGSAVIVVMLMVMTWWVRRAVRGKVYALFIEANKQISSEVLAVKNQRIETKGPGGTEEAYVLSPTKALWKHWPDGVPNFLKEPIPALFYVRNRAEPIDPFGTASLITAASLRYMLDEGMLKQSWKDARDAAGLTSSVRSAWIPIILSGLALLLAIVTIVLLMRVSGDVGEVKDVLGGL